MTGSSHRTRDPLSEPGIRDSAKPQALKKSLAYRQSSLLSDSGNGVYLERAIALAFFVIGIAVLVLQSVSAMRHKMPVAGTAEIYE